MICFQLCGGCFTTDKEPNVPCVFPFTYLVRKVPSYRLTKTKRSANNSLSYFQGVTYSGCTDVNDYPGKLWCATKVDENGSYIAGSKQYGYCEEDCPETIDIFVRTVDDYNGRYESDKTCGREE